MRAEDGSDASAAKVAGEVVIRICGRSDKTLEEVAAMAADRAADEQPDASGKPLVAAAAAGSAAKQMAQATGLSPEETEAAVDTAVRKARWLWAVHECTLTMGCSRVGGASGGKRGRQGWG